MSRQSRKIRAPEDMEGDIIGNFVRRGKRGRIVHVRAPYVRRAAQPSTPALGTGPCDQTSAPPVSHLPDDGDSYDHEDDFDAFPADELQQTLDEELELFGSGGYTFRVAERAAAFANDAETPGGTASSSSQAANWGLRMSQSESRADWAVTQLLPYVAQSLHCQVGTGSSCTVGNEPASSR